VTESATYHAENENHPSIAIAVESAIDSAENPIQPRSMATYGGSVIQVPRKNSHI
jgi:hypothetical protein